MRKIYVSMAWGFVALILVSLWHGLSGVHLADDTTADNVEAEAGK
jgi:hypothetical protein